MREPSNTAQSTTTAASSAWVTMASCIRGIPIRAIDFQRIAAETNRTKNRNIVERVSVSSMRISPQGEFNSFQDHCCGCGRQCACRTGDDPPTGASTCRAYRTRRGGSAWLRSALSQATTDSLPGKTVSPEITLTFNAGTQIQACYEVEQKQLRRNRRQSRRRNRLSTTPRQDTVLQLRRCTRQNAGRARATTGIRRVHSVAVYASR